MPKVTVYIRKEDMEAWKEIGQKTQFLHDAIHVQNTTMQGTMYPKIIKTPEQAKTMTMKQVERQFAKADGLCPDHKVPLDARGRCMQKKCKYS